MREKKLIQKAQRLRPKGKDAACHNESTGVPAPEEILSAVPAPDAVSAAPVQDAAPVSDAAGDAPASDAAPASLQRNPRGARRRRPPRKTTPREEEIPGESFSARAGRRLRRIPGRFRTIVAEKQKDNFPESNRVLIQLFLLLWGLWPAVSANVREHARSLRRRHHRRKADGKHTHRGFTREKRSQVFAFLGTAALLALVAFPLSVFTFGTTIVYNDTPLATVDNAADAQLILDEVRSATGSVLGGDQTFDESKLTYTHSIVRRSELSTAGEISADGLDENLGIVYGYSLYVEGELIGSTRYEGALEDLLDQMRQLYISENTVSVEFLEDVSIREGYVGLDSLVNLGKIASKLNSTKTGEVTYTVQKGDTWGRIANDHGLSSAQLQELNPGYNINRLSVGEVLMISNAVPYLTITVTERQSYVTDLQYDIIYQNDDSMYKGDYKTLSKGTYGKADVMANVTYVNGVETEREIISSVVLTEPVTELRAQGTKERPSWMATGAFRWPITGRITSYFGRRNTGIRGASTNHQGIDIACSYGASVCAADGGTVTYSGWWGSGGYTIIIDHGNGYKTYYEHNSSLLVSVGAHVYKGQTIARAGRTGVASGVHCHFGVMKNGSYVNPLKYLG